LLIIFRIKFIFLDGKYDPKYDFNITTKNVPAFVIHGTRLVFAHLPFWWNHLSTATSSLGISLFVLHLIFAWSECLKRFDGINVQNKKEKNDSGGNLPFLYYM